MRGKVSSMTMTMTVLPCKNGRFDRRSGSEGGEGGCQVGVRLLGRLSVRIGWKARTGVGISERIVLVGLLYRSSIMWQHEGSETA